METKLQSDWENIVYNIIEDHKGDDGNVFLTVWRNAARTFLCLAYCLLCP